jgi:genome maintenance exonuclease 1
MKNQKKFTHAEKDWVLGELNAETVGEGRVYNCPIGGLPSVTTITGWKKQKFFAEWRRKNPKESARVCKRGNLLHETIEDYLNNKNIDLSSMPPVEVDLFTQLVPTLNNIDNIYELESPLWSEAMGIAGRVDCIAEYNGTLSVIDFKGSTRKKSRNNIQEYFMQATAYAIAFQERTGVEIDNFAILISCEDGAVQVFEGKPKNYIKKLNNTIREYQDAHKETEQLFN